MNYTTTHTSADLAIAHQTITDRIKRAQERVRVRSVRAPRTAYRFVAH